MTPPRTKLILPEQRLLYYGGKWQIPASDRYVESINPGTGESLGTYADANASDMDAAVKSAYEAFSDWRKTHPLERGRYLRRIALTSWRHRASIVHSTVFGTYHFRSGVPVLPGAFCRTFR